MIRSVRQALDGILWAFRTQRSLRIQLVIGLVVAGTAITVRVTLVEAALLVSASVLVITLELMNTVIEAACDEITTERRDSIRRIKDVAAGAVAFAALGSIAIGILVFGHYLANAVLAGK